VTVHQNPTPAYTLGMAGEHGTVLSWKMRSEKT